MANCFTTARYCAPPPDYLNSERIKFQKVLGYFATYHNVKTTDFRINKIILDEVHIRVHQRLNYYLFFHDKDLAQSRQAGIKAYWILRYRPISSFLWSKVYDVNVYFAFFILFSEVLGECLSTQTKDVKNIVTNSIISKYESIFLRAFSEYDISKEAMMLVTESIKSICDGELKSHT